MFGRPANPYDEVVAKATDEKQTEINWEVALNVCDKVNDDGETGARNCVAAIQKRFTHRSANVQLFSLTLAGALVNNCSGSLHREISGKAFTQALTRLVNDRTTHDTVKKEALKQVETWVKEHPNNTDFDLLVETYEALKRQGHNFHPERPPTPKGPSDDLLRREEEELQRALAESAALADPRRNYQPSSSSARARSPSPAPSTARPPASSRGPSFVRGLYDFEGESSDELPFRRGDTIRVLEKVSDEWWRGELRGRTGIFPTNYIEELPEDFAPAAAAHAPAAAALNPDAAEAEIFAQAAAVDKLLALMHQLRARGEDFADNEELTDLYNSSMALRPKVVQLIRKYEQKQADLQAMNEKVDRARSTYEQMAGMHISHGYAKPNGYAAQQQQQYQPHPSADPYGRPVDSYGASPYHQHAPSSNYPQQPPHVVPHPAQQHQPPPPQQQQQQYQQAPPPVSAEDEAQREYERQMAEYQQKLAEYNAQVAALQAAGSPAPGPAGPAPSAEQPHPDGHQQQQHQQAAPTSQQAPQPVWDAQTGAWVWPAQSAAPPPPHEGAPAPALSPAPAQGYPSQTQPYGLDGASSPPPVHGQQQQSQGYPLAEHMAQLSVGAVSPPPPHAGAAHPQAYAQAPYGASATSPPPVQHAQPHPGSPHQHGAPAPAAQPLPGAYYAQQGAPPPQQLQADEQQAAWAAWHAQQQQQQQGPGGAQGPGSAGGR
ncbi:hypothetical protein JCM9279_003455 [Rhodotorula babjevae]